MSLQIKQEQPGRPRGFALWQLGFRPFFLLAGLSALILMGQWLLIYFGQIRAPYFANPAFWHSHELLFGYTVAVIAGFLLTAVKNWTGRQTLSQVLLMLLVLLWLAGRLVITSAGVLPDLLVMIVDVAFLPLLGVAIAVPLLRARQYPNLVIFLTVLSLMTLANILSHLSHAEIKPLAGSGIQLMYFLVMVLIAVMAGRVVPFFTERGLGDVKLTQFPLLERMAVLSLIVYAIATLLQWHDTVVMLVAGLALIANVSRWLSWHHPRLWTVPMLWVLHLAYLWLLLSLLFSLLARMGWVSPVVEVHAFTVGTLGMITLGMMTRVSQGHSGRDIAASRMTTLAFATLFVAAVFRVLGAIFAGSGYSLSIVITAAFWLLTFGLFVIEYMPILIRPRIDGRPG